MALIAGALAAPYPVSAQQKSSALPKIESLRVGQHPGRTRLVLDLTDKVRFQIFLLPDPYRVVIDMTESEWGLGARSVSHKGGIISGYRYGLFAPGVSRIVVDARNPVIVSKAFLLPPSGRYRNRLVLDLVPTSRPTFMAESKRSIERRTVMNGTSTPKVQPVRLSPNPYAVKPAHKPGEKRLIVLDPGHGGVDPGTLGPGGLHEETIVLRAAFALKKQLEQTGRYRVLMTRDRDIYIPLRERVAIGRRAGADLFISLHADSIGNSRHRGASVYTLSENSSDKEAAALAKKENKSDIIAGMDFSEEEPEVANILIDLAQRETMNYSAQVAELMVDELRHVTRIVTKGHRFAGFAVLKAPDVPSVLIELGYLSNRQEAKLLSQPGYRRKLAGQITKGVDRYFNKVQQAQR